MNYALGCKPDVHDARDVMFAPRKSHVTLPKSASWAEHMRPEAFDQGQIGSCVGNGTSGGLAILLHRDDYPFAFTPSRLFIYYVAREMEGAADQDAGCMIRDAFKCLQQYGCPPEDSNPEWSYPYSSTDNRWAQKPSEKVYEDAKKYHQLVEYARVSLDKDSLKQALCEGPVVFGLELFANYMDEHTAHTGKVQHPKGRSEGGHCQLMFGYGNVDKNCVDVRNSWGTGWGRATLGTNGNCVIPFDMIEKYGSDAWTPKLFSKYEKKAS